MSEHELQMNPEPHPPIVARVRVMGKDWQLLYMNLPVGMHDLYARQFSYRAPAQAAGSVTFTRDEISGYENHVETLNSVIAKLERKNCVLSADLLSSNGKFSVLAHLLREVLMPLYVSKMDAMTSGEDDDYRMIGDLEKRIKNAINDIDKGSELNSQGSKP